MLRILNTSQLWFLDNVYFVSAVQIHSLSLLSRKHISLLGAFLYFVLKYLVPADMSIVLWLIFVLNRTRNRYAYEID